MKTSLNIDIHPVPTSALRIRKAGKEDCDVLVELINYAGEGLPLHLWSRMAQPGEDAWDIGRERAARETGGFSYRNGIVAEVDGSIAGALIGYPLPDESQPVDYESMPRTLVPALELENIAAGTFYINAVAACPEARGLGIGTQLMLVAERTAAKLNCRGLSLIVSDTNAGARRLYTRLGYREVADRSFIKDGWVNDGKHWTLMVKDQAPGRDAPGPGIPGERQANR